MCLTTKNVGLQEENINISKPINTQEPRIFSSVTPCHGLCFRDSLCVGECTKKATVLSQEPEFVRNVYPTTGPECKMDALRLFFNTQTECHVNGVLLRGCRIW